MGCGSSKESTDPASTAKPETGSTQSTGQNGSANAMQATPSSDVTDQKAKTEEIEKVKQISKEAFESAMKKILDIAIDGYPKALRSVLSKRNELLRETAGDQDRAADVVKDKAGALKEEGKTWLLGLVPYVGLPASILYPTWTLMRRVCLLAAVYGLDMKSDDTRGRILHAFAGLRAVPAAEYALETAVQVVWTTFAGPVAAVLPVGTLVSKVINVEGVVTAQIGKEIFSEKRRAVPSSEFNELLDPEPTVSDYIALAKEGTAFALYTTWKGTQTAKTTLLDKDKREQALGQAVDTGKNVAQTVARGSIDAAQTVGKASIEAVNLAKDQAPKVIDKAKGAITGNPGSSSAPGKTE